MTTTTMKLQLQQRLTGSCCTSSRGLLAFADMGTNIFVATNPH
jgi:hypothetical protein